MAFDPNAAAPPGSGIFGLPHREDEAAIVLVPVPFAATVSYGGGAENGPDAILAASAQVDLYDLQYGRVYEHGIHMLAADGDVVAAQAPTRALVEAVLADGGAEPGSARVAPIVSDLANAALQFGLPPVVGSDPSRWEPRFNEHCLRAIVRGYRSVRKPPKGTSASIAPLMIQAAIAEVVAPVARKGAFGHIDGRAMLEFVDRKTQRIEEAAAGIATLCG
jgi:hypothetical protein